MFDREVVITAASLFVSKFNNMKGKEAMKKKEKKNRTKIFMVAVAMAVTAVILFI